MLELSLILIFIPTSFFISITPGMCMTLAMSLGMSIGIRRTLYMMYGELLGVATVAIAAVLGVAAMMLNYPAVFSIFKWLGGAYLIYIGVQMCLSKGKLSLQPESETDVKAQASNWTLFGQGYFTAVANPKGWAFMMSLLPPFINPDLALAPQLSVLIMVILFMEFSCMMLYATGGLTLKKVLSKNGCIQLVNRISGSLMVLIGCWLALG
ncbi:LysE family translocator [Psychrobium sp. 1_MG-2023]|uniref:LysE family translocator n=1 Tax=Psychrobium sp. 1_MG-2023 TaxID=3062624 RepID=UPI000C332FDF|nr:LysE family translocator [Psychrobium sp. 1_MG-2023]MDP2559541.1 LysE family translocator [Psychrobium sp. 1_MG-2023]PKF59380.1 threonine transporter RhtB [Alteromonadales bacterium alter-6D02]